VGKYAYVADDTEGLQIIDVSDSAHPVRVGGYDTPGFASGVAVVGNYAYVSDSALGLNPSSLQVIDVSNPANPVRVGGYGPRGSQWLCLYGSWLWLGSD
jgi:hypothetical protein